MGLYSRMQPCAYDLFMLQKKIGPMRRSKLVGGCQTSGGKFNPTLLLTSSMNGFFSGAFVLLSQSRSTDLIYAARA
jgi:hypothetical protein